MPLRLMLLRLGRWLLVPVLAARGIMSRLCHM